MDWDKYFDDNLIPYEKEERRGKSVKVTAKQVRLIVDLAQKKLEKEERILRGLDQHVEVWRIQLFAPY